MKWTREPHDVQVSIGKSVEVPCESNSRAANPRVRWLRIDEDGMSHELINFSGSLRLAPVELSHGGQYECQIEEGPHDKIVKRIKVDVLGK